MSLVFYDSCTLTAIDALETRLSDLSAERKEADNKIEELHQLVWHVMGRTRAECSKHRIVQVLN